MAETKKEQSQEARVPVFVPRGTKSEDPNLFVSINGKNYLLPRGKTSQVPPCVADEIDRAHKAQEALYQLVEELTAPQKS